MEPALQRRVQRYGWDRAAAIYEPCWRRQLEPAHVALLRLADIRPGARVIDVACGTGLVTFRTAAAAGPEGTVLGTDISEGMIAVARTRADRLGLSNTSFARMDAEALDAPDESFDAALCALGLMYFPDPLRSLGEMRRVLAPGGRAAVSVWGAREHCGWAPIFPIVDARVRSEVCPMFFRLGTGDALRLAMNGAGFRDITVERIATTLHYESAEEACAAAFAGGPVALAYSRFDARTRDEAEAEYVGAIEPWRRGERYELPGEFVVGCGVK